MLSVTGTLQLLVFRLNDRCFGLLLEQVHRVVRAVDVTPLPGAPRIVLGVIDLQGSIVPVLDVRGRFGLARRQIGLDDQFIIARTAGRSVALLVDGVSDVIQRPAQDVVAIDTMLDPSECIDGVVQLQDGLLLIHDLERFLSSDEEQVLNRALTTQASHA